MREHSPDIPSRLLTDREWTVLQLVAAGLSNQEIADHLTLSLTTVKWFLQQIFNKLGANRRTEAVNRAYALGLMSHSPTDFDGQPGLPAPATALIGRTQEVAAVMRLLDDPALRLVTIVGPGGMGKTHLALEVARHCANQQRGEVRFVALEAVESLSGVAPAIANAIGFQLHGTLDPGKQLLSALRSRNLLLVLDNFEHLLEGVFYVSDMLAAASRLKLLATSRERLNLHGETVFALRGLASPPESDESQDYAAFQLFLQAARRVQPTFNPTEAESRHVGQICRLVEGMPLGLELAASWMDVLTPEHIAIEIATSLAILQTTTQDVPERHRSIDAVFEHSWRLLSDAERAAFMQLSVFRGGFDRAAAQAVAGASLFMLSTLVDKSLMTRVGADRFKLHELLRQFAEAKLKLDANEYIETLHQHCQYYAVLTQQFERRLKADFSSLASSVIDIQLDFDNLLMGWNQAIEQPFLAEIGKYATSMSFCFDSLGLLLVGEETFGRALRLLETHAVADTVDRVRVMRHYGWTLRGLARGQEGQQILETAFQLAGSLEEVDPADMALLLLILAWTVNLNGQADAARLYLQEASVLCQKANFAFGKWLYCTMMGDIEYDVGYYDLALRYHREALLHCEEDYYVVGKMFSFAQLSTACSALGDTDGARDDLRRGLTLQRNLVTRQGFYAAAPIFITVTGVAALYEACDHPEAALELLAILLHHPQAGPESNYKAQALLTRLQSHFLPEHISAVLDKAQQAQLASRYLDPQFIINLDLIDRLLYLVESVGDA
jgi:predicted ATPase/DNA-binding CsgD family transcriptional regulator